MGIIKKEVKDGITTYTVSKDYDDAKAEKMLGKCITDDMLKDITIVKDDADVITEDGKYLMRFRKKALSEKNIQDFYDNIIEFARTHKTTNRGIATGSKKGKRSNATNKAVASNIIGYMDTWTPQHKFMFRKVGMDIIYPAIRLTYFTQNHHEQWEKLKPLIHDIDRMYRKLAPKQYSIQHKKAKETYFRIDDTAFTTITTNVNFNTCIHTDKGDDPMGLGNLVVLQKGEYSGAETCFPQYGVGVDARQGDFLLMDVHQIHGNTKLKLGSPDAIRLSIVSYLRMGIWEKTKHMTRKQAITHMNKIKKFYNKLEATKTKKNLKKEKPVFFSKHFAQSEHDQAKAMGTA